MAKVRYLVRFYTSHDLDLVTFTLTHDFDILRAMYSALTAFAKGESFIIQVPPATRAVPESMRRIYTKGLLLDTEKDKEAIRVLDMVVPGKRNSFLKNLLRIYLMYPFSECFFEDPEGLAFCEKQLEACREGRRTVRAGKAGKPTGTLFTGKAGETTGRPEVKQQAPDGPAPERTPPMPDTAEEPPLPAKGQEPVTEGMEGSTEDAETILSLFDAL